MSYRATLRRYLLILEKVSKPPYPSLEQLKETILEHGLKTSNRTLQRDIESIRDEFGIEITYDRSSKGYRLDEENSLNRDTFVRFLETFQLAELLGNNLKNSQQALSYIQFENIPAMQGIHWLKDILLAIREHRMIQFTHHNFQKNTIKTVRLKPYLLKEYLSRWYVVGKPEGKKEFRTYGVDRIEGLQVLNEKFTVSKADNPAKFFEQAIGVVYSGDEPEDVILEFTPLQGNYVKTLPWHSSQTIIKDDKKSLQIKLHVVINYELVCLILMHGKTVKVLHPKTLIKEVKKHLQDSLHQYEE
jgi:predicted DNA-binding transcriptional regulator YafY